MLLTPALFLKACTYFVIEGVFNFLFFPIDIASLYLNKQSTSTAFLQNIFHTNIHESLELVVSIWPIAVIIITLWGTYFVLAIQIENQYIIGPHLCKIVLTCLPTMLIIGFITMTIFLKHLHNERSVANLLSDAIRLVWMKLYKIYPYNIYLETVDIVHTINQQQELQKQIESFHFGIQPKKQDIASLYVLVIGETARYDHMSLNGYQRSTTPYLVKEIILSVMTVPFHKPI